MTDRVAGATDLGRRLVELTIADERRLRRQWDRHISHHWSMQPKTARGRATWTLRAAAMALSPVAEVPRVLGAAQLKGSWQKLDALSAVTRMRLYRARRMLAELVDPAARLKSAHWNRT